MSELHYVSRERLSQVINRNKFIIIDENIVKLHEEILIDSDRIIIIENVTEETKSLDTYQELIQTLLSLKINKDDTLLGIGGGVTCDLVGFIAATIFRGINLELIPTTLLSMVDAAIGGKNGLNTSFGKNLIGRIYFPDKVYIEETFLKTQNESEINSGKGEVLKYSLLDKDFNWNENFIDQSIAIKEEVIKIDPYDKSIRKSLNFGHTFGHAIEKMTGLSHGLCVIWGMYLEINLFWPQEYERFVQNLFILNLDSSFMANKSLSLDELISFMLFDKKNQNGKISFVKPSCHDYESIDLKVDDLKKLVRRDEYVNIFFR